MQFIADKIEEDSGMQFIANKIEEDSDTQPINVVYSLLHPCLPC